MIRFKATAMDNTVRAEIKSMILNAPRGCPFCYEFWKPENYQKHMSQRCFWCNEQKLKPWTSNMW